MGAGLADTLQAAVLRDTCKTAFSSLLSLGSSLSRNLFFLCLSPLEQLFNALALARHKAWLNELHSTITFPSLSCTLGTPASTHPVGTSSKTEVAAPLAGLPEAGKALHAWKLPWSPKPWSCPSHWPPWLPSLAWYPPHHNLSRTACREQGQWDSYMGKGAELHPTEKDFQEKEHVLCFWHLLTHSQQTGVSLNLPKQVSCPSSPSFLFSCLDNTHTDHNMQLIIPLENTLWWLWLAALFPCFIRVGMRVHSPYNSEGKQPESGRKCHPNLSMTAWGMGGSLLQHIWAAAVNSQVGNPRVVWFTREVRYRKLWLWF